MDLSEIGEFGLIARIAQIVGEGNAPLIKGIGDDAAVITSEPDVVTLLSTDAMVEGQHFRFDWMSPYQVGHRAAAAALSDIAAMGGQPIALFCTLCLPSTCTVERAEQLIAGLQALAARFGISLAGGDIVATDGPLVVDVVALGKAHPDALWLREGAQAGDRVLVTGTLGNPAAAIELLLSDKSFRSAQFPQLLQSLTAPVPHLKAAAALAPIGKVHGAIDISDGLLQDAGHVATASGVAMQLRAADIPVSEQSLKCAELLGRDPLHWAAAGGEDFQLLLTAPPADVPQLQAALHALSVPLTDIGEVTPGAGVQLLDDNGDDICLVTGGWDHFRS